MSGKMKFMSSIKIYVTAAKAGEQFWEAGEFYGAQNLHCFIYVTISNLYI